jgi:hypothetical protein
MCSGMIEIGNPAKCWEEMWAVLSVTMATFDMSRLSLNMGFGYFTLDFQRDDQIRDRAFHVGHFD